MQCQPPSGRTWGDLLHQDGGLGGQSEAMRVDARVPLDLNVEAEGVISGIRVAGLCCLSIRCNPVSGEGEIMEEKGMNLEQQLVLHLTYCIFILLV